MAETFLPARGCVYKVTYNGRPSKGFYSVEGLSGKSKSGAPVLIQGVDINNSDIIQPVVTLENTKILYTFGKDFGNCTIFGEILMGPGGKSGADGFNSVYNFFQANRVSVSKKATSVSLPSGKALPVFIYGLQIGRIDPEHHIQPFALTGLIAEK